MAKFKAIRNKDKRPAVPAGGLPCLILVIAGLGLVMVFLYFVMKYSA